MNKTCYNCEYGCPGPAEYYCMYFFKSIYEDNHCCGKWKSDGTSKGEIVELKEQLAQKERELEEAVKDIITICCSSCLKMAGCKSISKCEMAQRKAWENRAKESINSNETSVIWKEAAENKEE